MAKALRVGVAILLVSSSWSATAAVVVEPSFEELVREAREIIVSEVASSRADWRSGPDGRHIETTVTFKVDEVVKGAPGRERSLTFLGGRVGDMELSVSDMPTFTVGDRDVLFVDDEEDSISPIVGLNHGRFRITREGVVLTHESQTFGMEVERNGVSRFLAAPRGPALTLNAFLAHIRATAAAAGISLR